MPEDLSMEADGQRYRRHGLPLSSVLSPGWVHSSPLPRLGLEEDFTFLGPLSISSLGAKYRFLLPCLCSSAPLLLIKGGRKDAVSLQMTRWAKKADLTCFCYSAVFNPEIAASVFKREKGDPACAAGWRNGEGPLLLTGTTKGHNRQPGRCG